MPNTASCEHPGCLSASVHDTLALWQKRDSPANGRAFCERILSLSEGTCFACYN